MKEIILGDKLWTEAIFEFEVDAQGNSRSEIWEWK